MLPWDLEEWLGATVDPVLTKLSKSAALNEMERLVHDVWLFDTETRNGGVSQYFCNWPERWPHLKRAAGAQLPSFRAFAALVESVVSGSSDPYEAILASSVDLDDAYDARNANIVAELRDVIDARV